MVLRRVEAAHRSDPGDDWRAERRIFTILVQPIVEAWQLIDNGVNELVLLAKGSNR
jgi:hypothetical protein